MYKVYRCRICNQLIAKASKDKYIHNENAAPSGVLVLGKDHPHCTRHLSENEKALADFIMVCEDNPPEDAVDIKEL